MDDPNAQRWSDPEGGPGALDLASSGVLPFGEFLALTPSSLEKVAGLLSKRVRQPLELYARSVVWDFAVPMLRCGTLAEAQRVLGDWWDAAVFLRLAATGLMWCEAQRSPRLFKELSEGVPVRVRRTVLDSVRERLGEGAEAPLAEAFEAVGAMNRHLVDLAEAARQGAAFEHVLLQLQRPPALVAAAHIDVLLLTAILLFDDPKASRRYRVKVPPWIGELFELLRDLTKGRAAEVLGALNASRVEYGPDPNYAAAPADLNEALRGYAVHDSALENLLFAHRDVVALLTAIRGAVRDTLGEDVTLSLSAGQEDGVMRFWVKVGVSGGLDAVRAAQRRFDGWWLDRMLDADGLVSVMVRSA